MTANTSRSTVLTSIGTLVTNDPPVGVGQLGLIRDAAVVFDGGVVAWVGRADSAPAGDVGHDLDGRAVLPGFVESHSHLVFGGERAEEFAARMAGQPYAAGGIRNTIEATRNATDEQLQANTRRLLDESLRVGQHHRRVQDRVRADGRARTAQHEDRGRPHRRGDAARRSCSAAGICGPGRRLRRHGVR